MKELITITGTELKTKAWPEGTCLVMGVSALRHIIYETRMSRKFNVKV